jgi:hypothetical protein
VRTTDEPTAAPVTESNNEQQAAVPATTTQPKPTASKGLSTQKAPVEKHIRQAASSVLATINPSVPMTLKEKREKLAEIKKVGTVDPIKHASKEEERFLTHIFHKTLKEWSAGYEEGLLLLNPAPTIEAQRTTTDEQEKTQTVRLFGPVPKLDPDFLVPALIGYSANKMHTGQTMTNWDHNYRNWMQVRKKKKKPLRNQRCSNGVPRCAAHVSQITISDQSL